MLGNKKAIADFDYDNDIQLWSKANKSVNQLLVLYLFIQCQLIRTWCSSSATIIPFCNL
jgi:hypothetical protein